MSSFRTAAVLAGSLLLAASAVAQDGFAPAPDRVARALELWVGEDRIGGAVLAVARDDEPAYVATAGSLDGEHPMRSDAIFRIAALTLVEEGRLKLEEEQS